MQRRTLLQKLGMMVGTTAIGTHGSAQIYSPQRVLRVAHLTDVHIQPMLGGKGFEKCLHHLQSLAIKPDMIINGGDAIMEAHGRSQQSAKRQWLAWNDVIQSENTLPLYSCIGNHDIWCAKETHLAFEDGRKWAMDELAMAKRYYSIDKNGWHIIFLDSVQPKPNGVWYTAFLDDEQFAWLENDLKNTPTNTPILVVSHVPILAACVFYDGSRFEQDHWKVPGSWMHADSKKITDLFYAHKNVKACLSGHIHLLDEVRYNNISYYCNGAVSGAWWFGKYHETDAGYALVDLYSDGTVKNQYVTYKS